MRQQIKTEEERIPSLEAANLGRLDRQGERLEEARREFQRAWQAKVAENEWQAQRLREAGGYWMKRGRWCMRQALSCLLLCPLYAGLGYYFGATKAMIGAFAAAAGILGLGWAVSWMVGFGLCFAAERLRVKEIEHL